jgi:translocation and assembly module TamB
MDRAGQLLRAAGLVLLTVTAALGVALAAAGLLASTGPGSRWVAGQLAGALQGAVAGRFTLGGVVVTPGGEVELRDLALLDPEGRPVIRVARARARFQLTGLARRTLGVELELDRPEVLLEPGGAGRLTIAEALADAAGARQAPARAGGDPWRGWTVRVTRLGLHDGALRWRGERQRTWLEASGLELDGAGRLGPGGIAAGLSLRGKLEVPLQGPVEIELSARIEGTRLTVPRLVLAAAGSRLEALGEWDWARETLRAAATRLELAGADLATVAGRRVTSEDLAGRLYVVSDGRRLTAVVDVPPGGPGRGGGRLALALASASGGSRTIGFDAALTDLDPARLLARAPHGRITFSGRGAVAWPIPPPGPFSRGHLEVDRLAVALPGLELKGEGRWREAGALAGALRLVGADLGLAGPAVGALLGVTLPTLAGQAEASLTLAGTAAAPEATLTLSAPACTVAGAGLTAGRVELTLSGTELALEASAGLAPLDGAVVAARGAATLSPGWRGARLTRLEATLPGWAWTLAAPATLTLDPPSVDRAELRSGSQRLVFTGGVAADGAADARLELVGLELARLPRGLVPASLGLAGRADGRLRRSGPAARRSLDAELKVSDGAVASLQGLALQASLAWRGETGRARLEIALRRAEGGALDVNTDLPWPVDRPPAGLPMAGRFDRASAGLPVGGQLALDAWPVRPLLRALQVELAADGVLSGQLTLTGSVAAPRLAARAAVTEGRWSGLAPLALTATLDGSTPTLRAAAELTLASAALARATAEVPVEGGALLAHPARTLERLLGTPWSAVLEVPDTDLATLAGKAGLPAGLTGRLAGSARLGGTPAAPRGGATLEVSGLVLAGAPALSGRASVTLEPARTAIEARLESDGAPALRLQASVAAPAERLGRTEVQREAALDLTAEIPRRLLSGAPGPRWSPSGQVALKLEAKGTLASPRGTLSLDATGLKLGGQPVGDLTGTARTGEGGSTFEATLTPAGGGALRAEGTLSAVPGIQASATSLATAPLRLVVKGRDLSPGFLPALLPGTLRAATGRVQTELSLTGSARSPRLAGTLALADGTVTLRSWGTFTDVGFQASLDSRAVRLEGLSVRRGEGRLEGRLAVEGLDQGGRRLSGALAATGFTLARAGMSVATVDARARLGGRAQAGRVEVEIDVEPGGTVRLPRKAPRALQPIEDRPDIVFAEAPAAGIEPAGEGSQDGPEGALVVSLRVRGDSLLVKSDQPRLHVELRTDSTWEVTGPEVMAAGTLDAVQGSFEPIAGRLFKVVRGHVGFSGGPIGDAQLDLAADWEATSAKVHATVGGTIRSPKLRLTSEPALDEAALAMLIVTGKTELSAGGTAGAPLTAQDAGMAAAMAMANKAFEDQLGEKMPLDTLTLNTSAATAGKQLTDRIFVTYVRRFDAKPEKGENVDEVRVQYHLGPRWTLESRYGNAGAGGASLIWQKDY